MKRFGLIGYPLTHSFSGKYFTEKFKKEGLNDHVYELFPISSIDFLPDLISSHPDLHGLNVTIPYKQVVVPFLHQLHLPDELTACNCIRLVGGKLAGYNTDVAGFEKSFSPLLKPHHHSALVLGNGGATAAVKYVLGRLGILCNIVSRTKSNGAAYTYNELNEQIMTDNPVLINTTPLGTFPDVEKCPPIPYQYITSRHLLYDLVYNPSKTLFLSKGEEKGAGIKNGFDMLVLQAEESWKIWKA